MPIPKQQKKKKEEEEEEEKEKKKVMTDTKCTGIQAHALHLNT